MSYNNNNEGSGAAESRFHTVQPLRDLESNWGVDLAKNLEDYLLKICSGEISVASTHDSPSHLSVNFAEAALLLQGSIQVYSRKVEYLYNLVLHTLEFISQKSQQDQQGSTSAQPEESSSGAVQEEDNDFWAFEDIQVEAKNLVDNDKVGSLSHFVKPPANLVVLEGDCLDTTGETGELESYLLATNELYQDFILLDPCDAVVVDDFLKENITGKAHTSAYRGSCFDSKARKTFVSPLRRSGGSNIKSAQRKNPDVNLNGSPLITRNLEFNDINMDADCPAFDKPGKANHDFYTDDGFSDHMNPNSSDFSDDEDNDPWKPLNPHEPGNLKIKPFKKVKAFKGHSLKTSKRIPTTAQFPPAKMHGTVSPELMELWEKQQKLYESLRGSQSPPLYEKLRELLINGGHDTSFHPETENEDDGYDSDSPIHDDMPNMMDEDTPIFDKQNNDTGGFNKNEGFEHDDPQSQPNLEDLCRSHLDALLASISEAEKQTEIAARVSSWKQRIEHNLEEQDSRPPFDIHYYGDRILDTLSLRARDENLTSFGDVVAGQEKHDIARSFSALLQLVNNGNVDLERNKGDDNSTCYTGVNPFHVRLLRHNKRHEDLQIRTSKKRLKSPTKRVPAKCDAKKARIDTDSTTLNTTLPSSKSTPEGKRRRRSKLVKPVVLSPAR